MNNKGMVSIITPSYNTANYIEATIQSVLNQTYTNWEMIIVDDCSTDNTDEVMEQYNDDRIIYIKNEKNSGAAVSRNRALKMAKGKWIAFLDSDDIWLSEKLEKQIHFMLENDYHFSATAYQEIDEQSEELGITVQAPKHITKKGMYIYNWIGCLTVMYDQEYVGCIQIADIKKRNDYAIWLQVIKKTDCYVMNEVLAKYRRRVGSISSSKITSLLKFQYEMFKKAEHKNTIQASGLAVVNCFGGIYKKIHYVKKLGE